MRTPAGAPSRLGGGKKGFRFNGSGGGGGGMYWATLIGTTAIGLAIFYYYLFVGLRSYRDSHPEGRTAAVVKKFEDLTTSVSMLLKDGPPKPCPPASAASVVALTGDGNVVDPDAWLDRVQDEYPKMESSHYAMVTGIEPFERGDLKPWDLHVYPTDDWYGRAKKATDRCDLELTHQTTGAANGLADKVVWVSGLLDLKRGEAGNGEFTRSMDEYYRRFQTVLNNGFQMVIYIPEEFEKHLQIDYSRIKVIHMNMSMLRSDIFPYWDRLQTIRTSALWKAQADIAGWLANAPQARLEGYNPLVMSKLMLVRDAARLNPWGARYHLWMDAGHLCAGGQRPDRTSMYRKHMASGFFITHWPYGTTTEVHGFTDKAMHVYIGTQEDPLQIVRGGIFGGQLPHIECVLKAYIIALHQTLSDGYLGTEECIWAIIFARFPHLFAPFDNNSLGSHGDNCASFTANNMGETEIDAGRKAKFVSPEVPQFPSWWDAAQAEAARVPAAGSNAAQGGLAHAGRQISGLLRVGALSTGSGGKAVAPRSASA